MIYVYVLAAVLAAVARLIYIRLNDPLHKYPGPYLASWTDAWRMLDAATGSHRSTTLIQLHRKYGDVVRIGPHVLSFSQPQAVKDIYGTDKPYLKSKFYYTVAATVRGQVRPSLFSSVEATWHDNLRKAIQPAFNLSALVQYEPFVNDTIASFLRELDIRFANKEGLDGVFTLQQWMHWYAFDVVGELTYGSSFGCLGTASDVNGMIRKTHPYLVYNQVVGNMPSLDSLLLKNPILLWLNRRGHFNGMPNPVVTFALKRQSARAQGSDMSSDGSRVDLLDKFLEAKEKHPDTVSDSEVLGLGMSMVNAGSESTAVTLSAFFYYLLKNADSYKRLSRELAENLSNIKAGAPVPYQSAQKLEYLDACIKETFRLHPAARFTPERELPASGATIAGHDIPGNTIVGVNAWVLHRQAEVFVDDVEVFKPERWLADTDEQKARTAEMSRTLFHFGAGRFGCIGRNISLLEMYKVIPSLLLAFDFELAHPDKEWRFESGSFANVSGVDVKIRRRMPT